MKARTVTRFALLLSLALLLGYIESLLPIAPTLPGVKLGLGNFVLLYAVWYLGAKQTVLLMVLKVTLCALLFSGVFGGLYGLAGGILSVLGMLLLHRFSKASVIAISAVGGVLHNVGQTLVACVLISPAAAVGYLPFLLLSGLLAGVLLGILAKVSFPLAERIEGGAR